MATKNSGAGNTLKGNTGILRPLLRKYIAPAAFYRETLAIALPVMLQLLIQNLVSLVDNFMVSGLGDIKMSGVNVCGQILFVFMVLLNTICLSGGIFMSQYCGAEDRRGMRQALYFKFFAAGAAILVYLFACLAVPRRVLSLMVIGNVQAGAILDEGVKYMRLMSLAGVPMVISTAFASSLREIGRVRPPLMISVAATAVNTFLNWILIYGRLGAPRLEVRGAALATVTARCVEMVLFLIYVLRTMPPFIAPIRSADARPVLPDLPLLAFILRKGVLILVSEMIWVLSETMITAIYNGRGGADVVSGMAAAFAIANLIFVVFSGTTTAITVILGQTLGRGELDEARRRKNWLMAAALLFGAAMAGIGIAATGLVPLVFGRLSASAQHICRTMIVCISLYLPLQAYLNAQFAVSRAGGDTAMGAWADGMCTLVLMLPVMFLLARYTSLGPVAMYAWIKSTDAVKVVVCHCLLKKEKWVRNLARG